MRCSINKLARSVDSRASRQTATARRGQWREAEENAEKLRRIAESFPSHIERRRHHYLLGELARLRGELDTAVSELEAAERLLPPRGIFHGEDLMEFSAPHVPIWFALARAYLAVDRTAEARTFLERIHEVTFERAERPLEVLRSRELLAELES